MSRRLLSVLGAALLAAAMWIWVQAIAVPHQVTESAERGAPRGNLSDLYPRWLGARELLLNHRDPYGADITREIQVGYYGRLLDPTRPNDPKDQQAFAYPIYVVVMLAPTVTLDFPTVHRAFFWLLGALLAVSVFAWLGTLRWRPSRSAIAIWILLTLSCFPAIQGLKLQQLTVLVAALVAASMCALARRRLVLAGILLALATIKPQLVFLLVLWLCLWIAGDWRRRQPVLWSFTVTVAILVVTGEFLLPGWIGEFRAAMKDYYRYTGGGNSVLDVLLSPMWGRLSAVVLVAMLVVFGWRNRHADQASAAFQWSMGFTFATTLLVIPMFAPYNQLLLLPGLMIAVRRRKQLWEKGPFSRFFCWVTGLSVFWPFVSAAGLVVALLFLPAVTVQKAWGLPFYPSFAIPITIFAILLVSRDALTAADDPAQITAAGTARLAT